MNFIILSLLMRKMKNKESSSRAGSHTHPGYCRCNPPALLSISHMPDTGTCFIVSELFEATGLEFQERATV